MKEVVRDVRINGYHRYFLYIKLAVMSQEVRLQVQKIRIQKDEYQTAAGQLGEAEFWKSNENQAEVLQFKRAIATCRIEGPFSPVDAELIVSLRAGFVRVRLLKKEQGHDASVVAKLLQCLFGRLHHRPGWSPSGAFQPMSSHDIGKYMLCKTYDSHWLIAALHEAKEEKTMVFRLEDEELKNVVGQSPAT